MFEELYISNFGIADSLLVRFSAGLNTITGETGAGKTVIVKAAEFLAGGRFDSAFRKDPEKSVSVRGIFTLESPFARLVEAKLAELSVPLEEGSVILSRDMLSAGRGKNSVNGAPVPLSQYKEIASLLINIYGQGSQHELLDAFRHIEYLDAYADTSSLKEAYRSEYKKYRELTERKESLIAMQKDLSDRRDMLEFRLGELKDLSVAPGEKKDLEDKIRVKKNSEYIMGLAGGIYEILYGSDQSLLGGIKTVQKELRELQAQGLLADTDPQKIESAYCELEALKDGVSGLMDALNQDDAPLEVLEDRLYAVKNLEKKLEADSDTFAGIIKRLEAELEAVESSGAKLEEIDKALLERGGILTEKAEKLSAKRARASKDLNQKIISELTELGIAHPVFKTVIKSIENIGSFNYNGKDETEFYISLNKGEDLKPLSRIASGGEVSRIMLALSGICSDAGRIGTIIFDEIDTGIGGRLGLVVGQKLYRLAASRQVICVTHLPQVAAYTDNHYEVVKEVKSGKTVVRITPLEGGARDLELAKMLAGKNTGKGEARYVEELKRAVCRMKEAGNDPS